jgi:hypothetical protein
MNRNGADDIVKLELAGYEILGEADTDADIDTDGGGAVRIDGIATCCDDDQRAEHAVDGAARFKDVINDPAEQEADGAAKDSCE